MKKVFFYSTMALAMSACATDMSAPQPLLKQSVSAVTSLNSDSTSWQPRRNPVIHEPEIKPTADSTGGGKPRPQ